jgi:hypothetical protein
MGTILPDSAVGRVIFFEERDPIWLTNAVALGTTSAAVTALTAKTTAARAALNARQLLIDQTKAATLTLHDAVAAMTASGQDVIKQVKAKAATDGNAIYALALLPAPATPTPVPPPGMPTNFTAALNPDGSVKLRWKCANPAGAVGTMYQVARRVGGATGPFVAIGGSGVKSFTDATVPAGVAAVTYQITAVRSTATGVAAQFVVNFGVGGMGEMTSNVVAAPKLAA